MGSYLPLTLEQSIAQNTITIYSEILNQIDRAYYNDYCDRIVNNLADLNNITLKYIPLENNLRLYINTAYYSRTSGSFTIDRLNKTITWTKTLANGGFDIEPQFKIEVIYDIDYEENNLEGPNDIV